MRSICLLIIFICLNNVSFAQFKEGLDITFGDKGIALNENYPGTGGDDRITDALLQPDEKILAICGTRIVRFSNIGSYDSSFGVNGISEITLHYEDGTLVPPIRNNDIKLQSDGRIVVLASIMAPGMSTRDRFAIYRLLNNGTLDKSFGLNGLISSPMLDSITRDDIKIQADGKILCTGKRIGSYYVPMLMRFLENGVFDSTFGENGMVIGKYMVYGPLQIEIQTDGKILQLREHYKVARYLTNGDLDTSFNKTGIAEVSPFSLSGTYSPSSTSLAIDAYGKILIAGGTTADVGIAPYILARLNTDGSNDKTFGAAGIATFSWDTGKFNLCRKVLPLSDGSILLAGKVMNKATARENFGLIKVLPDGKIDNSFGDHGRILTQLNGSSIMIDEAYTVIEQRDQKIIAVGVTATPAIKGLGAMVRYYKNGTAIPEMKTKNVNEVGVYPNPGITSVTFHCEKFRGQKFGLYISDILGRKVLETQINGTSEDFEIEVNKWPSGVYNFKITCPEFEQNGKFIKQ